MPSWLLASLGGALGLILVAGALWWAVAAERKPNRWLPAQKEQSDSPPGEWGSDSGGHHGGGDAGGHH